VNGNGGNDANLYTNHDWVCSNSGIDHGGIIAEGRILMNSSCYVYNDAWANGSVSMSNSATVNHDVTSSTLAITLLNNTKVNNNATAGKTVTAPAGAIK